MCLKSLRIQSSDKTLGATYLRENAKIRDNLCGNVVLPVRQIFFIRFRNLVLNLLFINILQFATL